MFGCDPKGWDFDAVPRVEILFYIFARRRESPEGHITVDKVTKAANGKIAP
jgi:hypothetical protein